MMRGILPVGLIVALLTSPALAKGPLLKIKVGNWTGGSFTSDTTGSFSHCAGYTAYNSGVSFFVFVDREYKWALGFSHPSWRLAVGQVIPVDLTFDGVGPAHVIAKATSSDMAIVPMPDNSALIRSFRGAHQMWAVASGNNYAFNLDTTSRLLPALVACVAHYMQPKAPPPPGPGPSAPTSAAVSASGPSKEVTEERMKLIKEAANEHDACLHKQMRDLVPYSSESAETLAQVAITQCADLEKKFVSLGVALFGESRENVTKLVQNSLDDSKKQMVADIVSFRAELAKAAVERKPAVGNSEPASNRNGI